MAASQNDPKLLYAINGINAYHISNGVEETLTPAGPQTLSLLMVPTSFAFADGSVEHVGDRPEEDFYLHLHLPPELDLPLPATTQIYHQPPTSYLIPRWDLGHDSGAFTRIEFPAPGSRQGIQDDVDTFETILAQCTAFLERAQPPSLVKGEKTKTKADPPVAVNRSTSSATHASSSRPKKVADEEPPAYNPSEFKPGQAYVRGSYSGAANGGQIVLVDEENGSVIGELGEGFQVVEHSGVQPGSKDPVEITLPTDSTQNISVAPVSQEYKEMVMHPAYKGSFLVSNAALASRFIVTTSDLVSKALAGQADNFTKKTQPRAEPMTFKPTTLNHVRRVHTFTQGAAGVTSKAVGVVGNVAQNFGATLARRNNEHKEKKRKGFGPDGEPIDNYKPGLFNKSLMAFGTVADGIEQAGKNLLTSTTSAATTVVGHRWGAEAGEVSKSVGGGFKNVGLVYIDVTGVSRKAIVKSVAKGMVVGRVPGGGQLIVGGGDGGVVTIPENMKDKMKQKETAQITAGTSSSASSVISPTDKASVLGKNNGRP